MKVAERWTGEGLEHQQTGEAQQWIHIITNDVAEVDLVYGYLACMASLSWEGASNACQGYSRGPYQGKGTMHQQTCLINRLAGLSCRGR